MPTAFGDSIDNSGNLAQGATDYDVDVIKFALRSGTHSLHFKSWTSKGICPIATTTFAVAGSSSGSGASSSSGGITASVSASIPASAIDSANLDGKQWAYERDAATPGSARGSTVYPATTPLYDDARKFYMTYSGHGVSAGTFPSLRMRVQLTSSMTLTSILSTRYRWRILSWT